MFTRRCHHSLVKLKENEKLEKYLDLLQEFKMLKIMKVIVIQIIIGALVTIAQKLEKRSENQKTE